MLRSSRPRLRYWSPRDAPHDLAQYGMALQGVDGILIEGDPGVAAEGWWQDAYLYARAYTIAGGANEVLRNQIAERGLGVSREIPVTRTVDE